MVPSQPIQGAIILTTKTSRTINPTSKEIEFKVTFLLLYPDANSTPNLIVRIALIVRRERLIRGIISLLWGRRMLRRKNRRGKGWREWWRGEMWRKIMREWWKWRKTQDLSSILWMIVQASLRLAHVHRSNNDSRVSTSRRPSLTLWMSNSNSNSNRSSTNANNSFNNISRTNCTNKYPHKIETFRTTSTRNSDKMKRYTSITTNSKDKSEWKTSNLSINLLTRLQKGRNMKRRRDGGFSNGKRQWSSRTSSRLWIGRWNNITRSDPTNSESTLRTTHTASSATSSASESPPTTSTNTCNSSRPRLHPSD